jgi:hypothetical protein
MHELRRTSTSSDQGSNFTDGNKFKILFEKSILEPWHQSATHQALKSKMAELSRIDRTARSIKVGLELNDLALAQLDKADDER